MPTVNVMEASGYFNQFVTCSTAGAASFEWDTEQLQQHWECSLELLHSCAEYQSWEHRHTPHMVVKSAYERCWSTQQLMLRASGMQQYYSAWTVYLIFFIVIFPPSSDFPFSPDFPGLPFIWQHTYFSFGLRDAQTPACVNCIEEENSPKLFLVPMVSLGILWMCRTMSPGSSVCYSVCSSQLWEFQNLCSDLSCRNNKKMV